MGGESLSFYEDCGFEHHGGWHLAREDTGERIFGLYGEEIQRSNEIIATTSIKAPPRQRDDWGDWPVDSIRFILLRMIEETACHAGRLDAAGELIDRRRSISSSDEGLAPRN